MGLAAVLSLLLLIRFPNPCVIVLGLSTIILCVLEIGRVRECPRDLVAPGIALVVISLKLFWLDVILNGLLVAGPVAGLLAYYWRRQWWKVGLGVLGFLMLFLIVITFLDQPGVLLGGLAAAPISLALTPRGGTARRPGCSSA